MADGVGHGDGRRGCYLDTGSDRKPGLTGTLRRALPWAAAALIAATTLPGAPAAGTPGAPGGGAGPGVAPKHPHFVFTDLGTIGGLDSAAWAVGRTGVVVGHGDTSPNSGFLGYHAFRWTPTKKNATTGTIADLGAVPNGSSAATDVNAAGIAVGETIWPSGRSRPFYYDSRLHVLRFRGGTNSGARGIADNGVFVGYAENTAGYTYAVMWLLPHGKTTTLRRVSLGIPAGWVSSDAVAVNKRGQVAGGLADPDFYGYAAIWTPVHPHATKGHWTSLGLLPGGSGSLLRDINDHGVVVGQGDGAAGDRAFFYDGRVHVLEPLPGFTSSFAFGINDHGLIVGYCDDATGTGEVATAFVHRRAVNLNDWLPASARTAGYYLRTAYGVNNRGQIAGIAGLNGHAHAYLLTPVRH